MIFCFLQVLIDKRELDVFHLILNYNSPNFKIDLTNNCLIEQLFNQLPLVQFQTPSFNDVTRSVQITVFIERELS